MSDSPTLKAKSNANRNKPKDSGSFSAPRRRFHDQAFAKGWESFTKLHYLFEKAQNDYDLGHPDDKAKNLMIMVDIAKFIAGRMVPQLKAVEVTGDLDIHTDRQEIDALKEKLRLAYEATARS